MPRKYRKGKNSLSYDLRVRISAETAEALEAAAEATYQTRAQLARTIIENHFLISQQKGKETMYEPIEIGTIEAHTPEDPVMMQRPEPERTYYYLPQKDTLYSTTPGRKGAEIWTTSVKKDLENFNSHWWIAEIGLTEEMLDELKKHVK